MDIAVAIEQLIKSADYRGSTTANTKESYDNLEWLDERSKPSWEQLTDAWAVYDLESTKQKNNSAVISQIEKLEQRLIRPMTSIINNTATDADRKIFNDVKTEIATLRGQLK